MHTNKSTHTEKLGVIISFIAVLITIIGGACYISSAFTEMRTEMNYAERIKELEVKVEKLEKEKK